MARCVGTNGGRLPFNYADVRKFDLCVTHSRMHNDIIPKMAFSKPLIQGGYQFVGTRIVTGSKLDAWSSGVFFWGVGGGVGGKLPPPGAAGSKGRKIQQQNGYFN